ncbi:hypothetical protein VIGAN_06030000 [Vigna angularis var. angularis]|uniref:Uncharacterized protein n=1 Tax=Vigna angularis var. angularis TaxID=157739 RepID=A0A0S3S984_PHAAN|nr:hypothetical protein VIGAN_06030000 [Vigna angularis var. angularis]
MDPNESDNNRRTALVGEYVCLPQIELRRSPPASRTSNYGSDLCRTSKCGVHLQRAALPTAALILPHFQMRRAPPASRTSNCGVHLQRASIRSRPTNYEPNQA